MKEKRGGVILVGGGDGNMETACKTARVLLHLMNAKTIAPLVYSHNTDRIPSKDDINAIEGSRNLAILFYENLKP